MLPVEFYKGKGSQPPGEPACISKYDDSPGEQEALHHRVELVHHVGQRMVKLLGVVGVEGFDRSIELGRPDARQGYLKREVELGQVDELGEEGLEFLFGGAS